jgi:hypothetical protein
MVFVLIDEKFPETAVIEETMRSDGIVVPWPKRGVLPANVRFGTIYDDAITGVEI